MAVGSNEIKFWTTSKYRRVHGESLLYQIDTIILELTGFHSFKKMKNSFFSRGRNREKGGLDYGKYNL